MAFLGERRRWLALPGLAALALLAALLWLNREPPVTARPALWRISQGDRHGWLFGTIHAVPVGARWLSPAIEKAARESDRLVLEVTGLEAERADRRVFETLGRSPGLPPVSARLDAADRPRLAALVRASPAALRDLDSYESWAAALLIGAAANAGATSDDAPEARFEAMFRARGRPVLGLETIPAQLGLFDALPAADQQALLAQSVEEASTAPAQFAAIYGDWTEGDLKALEDQFLRPLDRYPRLRAALLDRRNSLWAQRIDALLRARSPEVPFIAVGAGHLLGPDNVQSRLARLGWKIERIQ